MSLALQEEDATRHHLLAWALAARGRFEEAARSRARGVEQGETWIWQRHMYQAYVAREAGNGAAEAAALDSAWSRAYTVMGRRAVDSVIVSEFGLPSRLGSATDTAPGDPGR